MNVLEGKRKPSKILISSNHNEKSLIDLCKKHDIVYKIVDRQQLDQITHNKNHQGVLAYVPPYEYDTLPSLLDELSAKKDPLILILDGIEDPNNFGSLIRTSACLGIDGIIISKNHQVQLTPTVSKVSTGGEEHVPIVQVTNISSSILQLQKNGFWIVASDGSSSRSYDDIDYNGKIAIVVGSEGKGISKLVLKNSDFIVKIPMNGKITSLNAAVAGAIILSQAISFRTHHN